MRHLVPCPECGRHVRVSEAGCPFCGVELDLSGAPPHRVPARRLGRAALFAFGASLAVGVVSCSSGDDGGDRNAYGAPPHDGGGTGGSGGSSGSGGSGGSGGSSGSAGSAGSAGAGGQSGGDGG